MEKTPKWLSQLPIIFGLLFVCLMLFVAVISTEKARNHYQGKKIQEVVSNIPKAKDLSPKIDVFKDKTPTPTPFPTPKPEKTWTEKLGEYEMRFLLVALPVFFIGLNFVGLSLGVLRLKNKDPQYKNPLILTNFFAMVACICLSFSLVILYLWALRVGLIG